MPLLFARDSIVILQPSGATATASEIMRSSASNKDILSASGALFGYCPYINAPPYFSTNTVHHSQPFFLKVAGQKHLENVLSP